MKIAIVEDEESYSSLLERYLSRLSQETRKPLEAVVYKDAESFLSAYDYSFGIVLMDIELGRMNGMEAAQKLRSFDSSVVLIFITNLARFANQGYQVNAMDFIIKPVEYYDFSLKMKKAIALAQANHSVDITIPTNTGLIRVPSSKLIYMEVRGHTTIYHLTDDTISVRGTMKEAEKVLLPHGFLKCNACYLVNPKFITKVKGYDLEIGGEVLKISQARHHEFMLALTDALAGDQR